MKSRTFLIKCVDFYQQKVSLFKRPVCVFYPTCSEYAKQAIQKYGAIRGSCVGIRRILRCHPWQKNHMDPVP